jgi:threonine aldolase
MAARVIDFRSDLLIPPSAEIKAAIMQAMDAQPEFELRAEPLQIELEQQVAQLLGKEDALLFPTCTMANEAALMVHCRPGDAAITEREAHVITSEAGAPGGLAGVMLLGLPGCRGLPDIDAVERLVNAADSVSAPRIKAMLLENTHLRSGGSVLDFDRTRQLRTVTRQAGVATHLDGARLFNAAVASAKSLAELACVADSVALSLNKGLGAPFGAMLAGERSFIAEALRVRHRLGGGFRPTAVVSAAALAALRSFAHIGADHRRASELATTLGALPQWSVEPTRVDTNIVFVSHSRCNNAQMLVQVLDEHGVKVLPFGEQAIRLVTHRGIDDDAVARTLEVFRLITTSHWPQTPA